LGGKFRLFSHFIVRKITGQNIFRSFQYFGRVFSVFNPKKIALGIFSLFEIEIEFAWSCS